jgi:hypothetical protein
MIPQAYITEWANHVPWQTTEQVEQDLFDIYKAISVLDGLDFSAILACYSRYIEFSVDHPPGQKLFFQNLELKMKDDAFYGDIKALIRPEEQYDQEIAYERIKEEILRLME